MNSRIDLWQPGRNDSPGGLGFRGVMRYALGLAVLLAALFPAVTLAQTVQPWPSPTPRGASTFIAGQVYEDADRNGELNRGEAGFAKVTISLQRRGSNDAARTVRTDDSGRYRFSDLAPATYVVAVQAPSGFAASADQVEVSLAAGTGRDGVNFGLASTVRPSIIGLVYNDANRNEALDSKEDGIADVQLTLERADNREKSRSVKSSSNGKYQFNDLSPGTYVLTLKVPDKYTATTPSRLQVTVTGTFGDVADFGLARSSSSSTSGGSSSAGSSPGGSSSGNASGGSSSGGGSSTNRAPTTVPTVPPATPTPVPTAAAPVVAPTRLPTATPTPSATQRLTAAKPVRTARFLMEGALHWGDVRGDFLADGLLVANDQLAMRFVYNDRTSEVVIIGRDAYVKNADTGDVWQ